MMRSYWWLAYNYTYRTFVRTDICVSMRLYARVCVTLCMHVCVCVRMYRAYICVCVTIESE